MGQIYVPSGVGHHHVRRRQATAHRAHEAHGGGPRGVDDLHGESRRGIDHLDEHCGAFLRRVGEGRLFRFAVDEHGPDLRLRRKFQPQELATAVAHVETRRADCQAVTGVERRVVCLLDGRHLHVDLAVPGDLQGEPKRRLGVHVLVGEQDRVGGFQHKLLRQLVDVEGRQLLDGRCLNLQGAQRLDRDAAVLHLGLGDAHGRHCGGRLAVCHDALVVHLETKLTFHLLGEIDVDGLIGLSGGDVEAANRRSGHVEHVDIRRHTQGKMEYRARLDVDLHRRRAFHGDVADGHQRVHLRIELALLSLGRHRADHQLRRTPGVLVGVRDAHAELIAHEGRQLILADPHDTLFAYRLQGELGAGE